MPRDGKKKAVDTPLYWTPPARKPGESVVSRKGKKGKEKVVDDSALYYQPPQTPQEAIDRGLVPRDAIKPGSWLPHEKRNWPHGLQPNPKYWSCVWGCVGTTVPACDVEWPKSTHDYYCPYWQMLALFPEWADDFQFKPWHRPPQPDGEERCEPYDEWNQKQWTFLKPEIIVESKRTLREKKNARTRDADRLTKWNAGNPTGESNGAPPPERVSSHTGRAERGAELPDTKKRPACDHRQVESHSRNKRAGRTNEFGLTISAPRSVTRRRDGGGAERGGG